LSPPPEPAGRLYGRAGFLFLVAGGLSPLAWASPALRLVDSLLPGGAKALLLSQGWRIYTIGDSMPRFDPRAWRLHIDGLVARPRELSYEELLRLPRAEQDVRLPLRDRLNGAERPLGRRPLPRPAGARPPAAAGARAAVRLGRAAVRGHAHARAGAQAGRDSEVRAGGADQPKSARPCPTLTRLATTPAAVSAATKPSGSPGPTPPETDMAALIDQALAHLEAAFIT
jgi:hypothetical protein